MPRPTSPRSQTTAAELSGQSPRFRRVLLKLSGEALMGADEFGISPTVLAGLAEEIIETHALGVELAIVVGGGNIFRGAAGTAEGLDRVTGDHMGMLATLINSLAVQDVLERRGIATRILSALDMRQVAEPFIRRRAIRHLEKGRVVILAAGTGNPYFTTDTAAALRAAEIDAEVILMAKSGVDGVYDNDPKTHPDAVRYEELSYDEVLQRNLRVMDQTAVSLCAENELPILVFDMTDPDNIVRAIRGGDIGTLVHA